MYENEDIILGKLKSTETSLVENAKHSTDFSNYTDLVAFINSKITTDATLSSNNFGNTSIFIPAGKYIITDVNLLNATLARVQGLNIIGAGRGITRIVFSPTLSNQYLFKNNDCWLHVNFQDMSFYGDISKNTNFMQSISNGGGQNYTFERCNFKNWNYILKLEGSNNNSELTFIHCGFYGIVRKVLYAESATSSDQFLNYNFFACQYETAEGDFIHLEKGGNVNIWGGSFIHSGANGGTFFKLYGNSHAYGVQRFLCIGTRFEHRYTTSMLIDSQWNDGNISFISCDTSSQSQITGASTMVVAKFSSVNQKMPSIKFDGCSLMGQHKFEYSTTSWNFPHNVEYENCEFTNATKPIDFVVYTDSSNLGGRPAIRFKNCRNISNNQNIVWDTTLNFNRSIVSLSNKKIASIRSAGGGLPNASSGVQSITLPIGSIITNVYLYSPLNGVTSYASGSFTVQTNETTPTILGQANFSAFIYGFNSKTDQFFVCDTDAKCQLSLVTVGADQTSYSGYCLIEYI